MRTRQTIVAEAVLLIFFALGALQASCGSASCTMDTRSEEHLEPHQLILDLSYMYIHQDEPRIGNHPAAVGELPNPHHDEIETINRQVTGRIDYAFSDRWAIGLSLPVIGRTHEHFSNEASPPELESWRFTGLGDLVAEVRYAFWAPQGRDATRVYALMDGKFPTGTTTARNAAGELAEPTLQPGTGSYDWIGGLGYWSPIAAVPMLTPGQGRLRLYGTAKYRVNTSGIEGYRMGNEILASQGVNYPVTSRFDVLTEIDVRSKAKDHRGNTEEDTDFTGGDFIWFTPGFRMHLTRSLSFYGLMQFAVYRRVNNEQITADKQAMVGLTFAL
jgi:hypothetical protein